MSQINLIITCEECGEVKHYRAIEDSAAEGIFNNFRCAGKCNRTLLSYITIGQIKISHDSPIAKQVA